MIMASMAARLGKKMMAYTIAGQTRGFVSPTAPRFKPYAPTISDVFQKPKQVRKGDLMPVCVMMGLLVTATMFGAHTVKQQLMHAPNVFVKKSKREMVPEVYQPEQVLEESDKFLHNSFFRRVAHLRDHKAPNPVPDPIHGNAFHSDKVAETLRSVGTEP